ncbi:MAG TPA: hypothetical protein VF161_02385 [Steroidobacteraceae bacterium]|jgi:hypothetical protein
MSALSHTVTSLVEAPASAVFEFLTDPLAVGRWALASAQSEPSDRPGVYVGRSLFDGSQNYFTLKVHPELLLVEYSVGQHPDELRPRIRAQVIRPESVGLAPSSCYLTLIAWRPTGMPDSRWSRLCATHEVEMWLIKEQIEAAAKGRPGRLD